MKVPNEGYTILPGDQASSPSWVPMVDIAHRALIASAAALVVLETFVGPADWIAHFTAIAVAVPAVAPWFPTIPRSIISLLFGLLEVAIHWSYRDEWLGVLCLIVAWPLTAVSVVMLVLACKSPSPGGKDSWLPVKPASDNFLGNDICRGVTCCFCSILLLWVGFIAVAYFLTESTCVYESYYVGDVLKGSMGEHPAMMMGTDHNMDLPPHVNMTGIWWINFVDNPIPFYNKYHVEELVTFEGAKHEPLEAGKAYPAHVPVMSGTKHHWGFTNTIVSRIGMVVTAYKADPMHPMDFTYYNKTVAWIGSGDSNTWWVRWSDDNRWVREIERPGQNSWYYNLDRVILPNGEAGEHWGEFTKHMGRTKIRVWTTNSKCFRECAVLPWKTCGSCKAACDIKD